MPQLSVLHTVCVCVAHRLCLRGTPSVAKYLIYLTANIAKLAVLA